jgi:hypothetical protein
MGKIFSLPLEQEILEAIDPTPQLKPEPEPEPEPTIYDLGKLLSKNEPTVTK